MVWLKGIVVWGWVRGTLAGEDEKNLRVVVADKELEWSGTNNVSVRVANRKPSVA